MLNDILSILLWGGFLAIYMVTTPLLIFCGGILLDLILDGLILLIGLFLLAPLKLFYLFTILIKAKKLGIAYSSLSSDEKEHLEKDKGLPDTIKNKITEQSKNFAKDFCENRIREIETIRSSAFAIILAAVLAIGIPIGIDNLITSNSNNSYTVSITDEDNDFLSKINYEFDNNAPVEINFTLKSNDGTPPFLVFVGWFSLIILVYFIILALLDYSAPQADKYYESLKKHIEDTYQSVEDN